MSRRWRGLAPRKPYTACESSPTTVRRGSVRRSARSTSTCSALTSWYSSTQTWSISDASSGAEPLVGRGRAPVEEQIVEVDEAEHALAVHVAAADRRDRFELIGAPRRDLVDDGRQRPLRVDRARVHVEQRRLLREPPPGRVAAPCSSRTRSITSAASPESSIEKPSGSPSATACRRRVRCAIEWNVPPTIRARRRDAGERRRVGEQRLAAVHHLARRAPGEGERHDALGRDPARRPATRPGPSARWSCRCRRRRGSAAGRPRRSPPPAARRSAGRARGTYVRL